MKTKKIRILLIILTLFVNVFLIFVIHRLKSDYLSLNDKLLKVKTLYMEMKESITVAYSNQGFNVDNVKISCDMDNSNIKPLSEYISEPCLIIYIPYSEGACMSCVDFAIKKVESYFSDFSVNSNICIITSRYNPNIKSRVYQKDIYHLVHEDEGLGIPADKIIVPHYFTVDDRLVISSFFIPNSSNPQLTDEYLESVKKILQIYASATPGL